MDWSLIIERLRWFGKNYTESANALMFEHGRYEDVRRYRDKADLCYTLAACLDAGMPVHDIDGIVNEQQAPRRSLSDSDAFCPSCGHNRDKSSVSSIDHGGFKSCQKCGATWTEIDTEQNGVKDG